MSYIIHASVKNNYRNTTPVMLLLVYILSGLMVLLLCIVVWQQRSIYVLRRRADRSLARSRSVVSGQIAEQLMPFIQFPFDPKDARFIGSPIDFVVFDGLYAGNDQLSIHLVEVKTGSSKPSKRQKQIRDAVQAGRVHWQEIYYP